MQNANSLLHAHSQTSSLLFLFLICLLPGCSPDNKDSDLAYVSPLDGAWGSESVFADGTERMVRRIEYRFVISGSKVRFGLEGDMQEGKIKFSENKSPNQFDIVVGNDIERAIYKLDGNQLTVCISLAPRPRPVAFRTTEGDNYRLFHLRKIHVGKIGTPVTANEFQELVDRLEDAANSGDAEALNTMIDLEGVIENATQGYGLEENMRLSFISGLKSNSTMLGPTGGLGKGITDPLQGGGNFEFIRSTRGANGKEALFRAVQADGELVYYKFLIGRNSFGETRVVDLYNFSTAEWLSKTFRQGLFPTLASVSPIYKDSPTKEQKVAIDSIEDVRQLSSELLKGNVDRAIEIFYALPTSVQAEKNVFVSVIREAIYEIHPELGPLIQKGRELFPADPGLEQLYLDFYLTNGQYKKAHQSLDFLENAVGGDPYLGTVRGLILFYEEKYQEAEAEFKKASDANPKLSPPYGLQLMLSLHKGTADETLQLCKILESKFDWTLQDFEEFEGFESFKQTEAFRKWDPER